MRRAILSILLSLTSIVTSAQSVTISGYVTDARSGEPLIGAAVIDSDSSLGSVSGNSGFFSLSLAPGQKTIVVSYLGYEDHTEVIDLRSSRVMNFRLDESTAFLEGALVTAHHSELGAHGTQMSAIEVPLTQIKSIPAIAGEVDVIKALQLLPGVQSGTEGSAGLYVRGGGPDENLLLMDGVPLYNVNHLFGFFSVFNADALKNVTLYKGSFPARFGGHLSSVIDVRLNDGNENEYHGSVSVGLISSKINVEGPIVKGRTTFNVSARRTYLDLIRAPYQWMAGISRRQTTGKDEKLTTGYDFYDLNLKLTHKLDNGDRMSLTFYTGDDNARMRSKSHRSTEQMVSDDSMKMDWRWGNLLSSFRWNHAIGPKLYMYLGANYTQYRSNVGSDLENSSYRLEGGKKTEAVRTIASLGYLSLINDVTANTDFDWSPTPQHDIKFGSIYTFHAFNPGVNSLSQQYYGDAPLEDTRREFGNERIHAHEAAGYLEDNWILTPWLKANLGVRASLYGVSGKTYASAEPRVSARALLTDDFSIKASYSTMSQYIHLLSNSSLSLPSDMWVPVTTEIRPMKSQQAAAGVFYDFGMFDLSAEAYYKTMDNVIEYKDGASYLGDASRWEDLVSVGRGWSYGVELFAQKKVGKTTGWIGYTWSKAMRQFDREGNVINDGKPFPARHDRRHDLSMTVTHRFSRKFDLSANFVYATGNRGSLGYEDIPDAKLGIAGEGDPGFFYWNFYSVHYIPHRNNYRMPAYHRLDVGMNFYKQKEHGERIWNISIYNVYSRLNPFIVTPDLQTDNDNGQLRSRYVLRKIAIFPILPSFSYTYKF